MKTLLYAAIGFFGGLWSAFYIAHSIVAAIGEQHGLGIPGEYWWNMPLVFSALGWMALCTLAGIVLSKPTF